MLKDLHKESKEPCRIRTEGAGNFRGCPVSNSSSRGICPVFPTFIGSPFWDGQSSQRASQLTPTRIYTRRQN